jgi:multidrug efflux pump subunit AcrB
VRFNGEEAMALAVGMRAGANGLALGEELHRAVAGVEDALPLGVDVHLATDQAAVIEGAFHEFIEKFVIAVGVVLLISFLALGLSAGVIVALSVPLTLAITFMAMDASGMQFQRITLGSLILALGLLVDDAIIAIEMMLVKMEEGMDRVAAATFAWTSTAFPMLTGTLVTVAGFLPVGFAPSTAGEYAGRHLLNPVPSRFSRPGIVAVVFTPYSGVKLLPGSWRTRSARGVLRNPYDTPPHSTASAAWCGRACAPALVIALTLGPSRRRALAFTQCPSSSSPPPSGPEPPDRAQRARARASPCPRREVGQASEGMLASARGRVLQHYGRRRAPRF